MQDDPFSLTLFVILMTLLDTGNWKVSIVMPAWVPQSFLLDGSDPEIVSLSKFVYKHSRPWSDIMTTKTIIDPVIDIELHRKYRLNWEEAARRLWLIHFSSFSRCKVFTFSCFMFINRQVSVAILSHRRRCIKVSSDLSIFGLKLKTNPWPESSRVIQLNSWNFSENCSNNSRRLNAAWFAPSDKIF
jgi:hypothetical protein